MNGIYLNYQIDLSSNNNFVQYNTVQGDGNDIRQIEIELIEHNKPYVLSDDVEVFIAGTKPDTTQIFNSCEVTERGTILIDVTTQMSAVSGRGDYQIMLISKTTNQQLKSFPFILFVKEAAFDIETITSSNEFHALNGMVNKIESTLNKTDLVDSMLQSSSKILEDTTTAVIWGLGSPNSDTSYAYHIGTGGTVYNNRVYRADFAPRPAFNLKSSIVVSSTKDSEGCYTLESVPVAGGGVYVKQNGVWVRAV